MSSLKLQVPDRLPPIDQSINTNGILNCFWGRKKKHSSEREFTGIMTRKRKKKKVWILQEFEKCALKNRPFIRWKEPGEKKCKMNALIRNPTIPTGLITKWKVKSTKQTGDSSDMVNLRSRRIAQNSIQSQLPCKPILIDLITFLNYNLECLFWSFKASPLSWSCYWDIKSFLYFLSYILNITNYKSH